MYHAIVFLPLIGFLIAGLFGRLIGARGTEVAHDSVGQAVPPQVIPEQLIEQQASAKPKVRGKSAHKPRAKRGKRGKRHR